MKESDPPKEIEILDEEMIEMELDEMERELSLLLREFPIDV